MLVRLRHMHIQIPHARVHCIDVNSLSLLPLSVPFQIAA